jgi:hypothetical protein
MLAEDLDTVFFRNPADLPTDLARRLISQSASENDNNTLTSLGWEGQTIGYIGLVLTPDGRDVSRA